MRKPQVAIGLMLALALAAVVAVLLSQPGSVLHPTISVRVYALDNYAHPLADVTVSAGGSTVVTTKSTYPVLSLELKSYNVTASWQNATLTKTITVVNASSPVIIVTVNVMVSAILGITFSSW